MNVGLVNLGIAENLLDGLHGRSEEILTEFLESSSGDGSVEVDTFEERVDLDGGLGGGGERSLGSLAGGSESSKSSSVGREILLVLSLEFSNKVGDESVVARRQSLRETRERERKNEPVVEILSSEMSVSGGSLDLEDTLLNREERDIESSSSEIENENVLLSDGLLVESVSDGGGGRLVDDSENVHSGDDTGVLGGLSLRIVEVGGDGDNCIATTRQASFGVPRKGED